MHSWVLTTQERGIYSGKMQLVHLLESAQLKGLPDGLTPAAQEPFNFWGSTGTSGSDANARYIYRDAMPWPIATAAEMEFLKAEAYYRLNLKPQAHAAYISGISKNWDMLTDTYSANVPPARQLTPAMKTAFLANPVVVPSSGNLNLSYIMLQKYIALFGFGFMEVWVYAPVPLC